MGAGGMGRGENHRPDGTRIYAFLSISLFGVSYCRENLDRFACERALSSTEKRLL